MLIVEVVYCKGGRMLGYVFQSVVESPYNRAEFYGLVAVAAVFVVLTVKALAGGKVGR